MTTTSVVFHVNRLGALLRRPGGIAVSKALADAEANVESIRGEIVAEVDRALEQIATAAAAAALPGADDVPRRKVYEYAKTIAGLAGSAGLEDIGAAALNLCKLTDAYMVERGWNAEAVAVHLSVMGLLRSSSGEGDAAMRRCVLAELTQLVQQNPVVRTTHTEVR